MNWLIFVAIAVFLDVIRIFTDNYVSDVYFKGRGAPSQKIFYGIVWVFVCTLILIFNNFSFSDVGLIIFIVFFTSGFIGSLAGIPYYKALEIEDSTNLGIFIQLAPVLYLIFGWIFLGESISLIQLAAFIVIISAPILIISTTKKRSRKVKLRAVFYAFLYVLISVLSNIMFVKVSTPDFDFLNQIAITFLGSGVASLLVVGSNAKWRKRFFNVVKKNKPKIFIPFIANSFVSFFKSFFYRLALVSAPAVAIASVTSDSAGPIAIFFMGIVFTLIWPKFGREKLNRKNVLVHLVATLLVVVGIVLLQI